MSERRPPYPPKWLKVITIILGGPFLLAALACDVWPGIVPFAVMRVAGLFAMLFVILVCPMRPGVKLWHRVAIFAAILAIVTIAKKR
jgi:hypothetical protein